MLLFFVPGVNFSVCEQFNTCYVQYTNPEGFNMENLMFPGKFLSMKFRPFFNQVYIIYGVFLQVPPNCYGFWNAVKFRPALKTIIFSWFEPLTFNMNLNLFFIVLYGNLICFENINAHLFWEISVNCQCCFNDN